MENTTKEVYAPETLSPGLGIVLRFLRKPTSEKLVNLIGKLTNLN